jgi:23S rRNA (uracil1939-C5)-methyltransferase
LELTIEKMIYGGDGLARLPADEHGRGKAVFVPFVLPAERVDVNLIEDKPGFARAALNKLLESSPHRNQPGCPYYMRCGGCHYQHTAYEQQLGIKASILKESLRRIAKLELATELQIHPSPPWNYRNRTRLRVQSQPTFALGYNRYGSHELEPVEQCPISSPLINEALDALWKMGRAGRVDSGLREIEFFADGGDSQLLLEIYVGGDGERDRLGAFAQELCSEITGVTGAVVFPEAEKNTYPSTSLRVGADAETQRRKSSFQQQNPVLTYCGAMALQYETTLQKYRVSAGSFFQTNRHLADELLSVVTGDMSGQTALDLYAGVGLFAAVLARQFERVIAVESSPQSFADLEYNSPENVRAVHASVDDYLERAGRKRRADLIVVDPPRGGLGKKVIAGLVRVRPQRLTYVSCDPATLARDLVPLLAAGYRVEQAHLVDLFPQTFHIESVLKLALSS